MDDADAYGQRGFDSVNGSGAARRKRRRQRPQRNSRPHGVVDRRTGHSGAATGASREQVFQDVEGLLRRIREHAEETTGWTDDELRDVTHTVTSFTRALEQESDPLPDRALAEYQRIRDKLNHALKSKAA